MSYRFQDYEVQDALAVVGQNLAKNYKLRVKWNNGGRVAIDMENGVVHVPRLSCASVDSFGKPNAQFDVALMLTRSNVAHEFGHGAKTIMPKAVGALFAIFNALEDVRMERAVVEDLPGYSEIFGEASRYHNRKIAGEILDGKVNRPLWEALVAMMFQCQGIAPAWNLQPQAKRYFDVAYSEFIKILAAKDSLESVEIAKRIYDLLKQSNKEDAEKNQSKPQKQPKQDKQDKQDKQEQQEDGEGGEGDDSQKQDSEDKDDDDKDDKKSGKSKKQDKKDEDDDDKSDDSGSGSSEMEDDEDKDDKSGDDKESADDDDSDEEKDDKKSGKKSDEDDEEDGEDGDGKEDGKDDADDADADGKSGEDKDDEDEDGKGKSDKENNDASDDDADDSESNEQGADDKSGDDEDGKDGKGEAEDDDDEDVDGDASGKSDADKKLDEEAENDSTTDDTSCKPEHDTENYEPEDDDEKTGGNSEGVKPETDEEIEARLAREAEGQSLTERANDEIEKAFTDLQNENPDIYTSRRDMDEHRTPAEGETEKMAFSKLSEKMQAEVATMTTALEQSLRAITRCRKDQFLRAGRLDNSRLVEIAKGLSKNVFFQTRKGKEIDTAVSIIIDQSGSMGNYAQIRDLVILLSECMDRLGIKFEIIGTMTKYNIGSAPRLEGFTRTNPIVYDHFKNFEEQWTVVRQRMVRLGAFSHNIDGEAVEFAAKRVSQRTEARKIVFSLCDGEPCGGQGTDVELGQNIIDVCKRARAAGIEVFGVGIDTEGPSHYYGKENFIHLQSGVKSRFDDEAEASSDGLGQQFVRVFAAILTNGLVRI